MSREYVLGRYRLLKSLGSGGFAKVYLGQHIDLDTPAAIKVLRTDSRLSQAEKERFRQEARTIAQLKHPHIIRILDFNADGKFPYLVMEYAPNGSLSVRYQGKPALKVAVALSYIKQVASALQFAHDRQVVHCDVKPENMLLGDQKQVLLTDFGIAVVLHSNLRTQQALGTMHYMSPEQFAGKPERASDQYALAVTAYRWLSGHFPFTGHSVEELYHQHCSVSPLPLHQLNPNLSPALDDVVQTALAKDPRHRFSSIAAFASALEEAAALRRTAPSVPTLAASPSASAIAKVHQPREDEPQVLLPSLFSLLPPATPQEAVGLSSVPPTHVPQDETIIAAVESHLTPILPQQPDLAARGVPPAPAPVPTRQPAPVDEDATILAASSQHFPPAPAPIQASQGPVRSANSTHVFIYRGHSGWVTSLAWSPDGTRIASGSWDTTVQVWSVATGNTLQTYRQHTQPVKSVSWSPAGGGYIASGSWDTTAQVWEATTGERLLPDYYRHQTQVEAVAWSPNGRYIASAGVDGLVQVWHAFNKRTIVSYAGHRGQISALSWSPDARYIASASHDHTVHIWEAQTGKVLLDYKQHNGQVTAVAWSPDGRQIASADEEGLVHLWSVPDGRLLRQYQSGNGAIKALCWSPDGTYLAAAAQFVSIWHTTATSLTPPNILYKDHRDWVNALAWSPDGRVIASASDDETVQIWNPYA